MENQTQTTTQTKNTNKKKIAISRKTIIVIIIILIILLLSLVWLARYISSEQLGHLVPAENTTRISQRSSNPKGAFVPPKTNSNSVATHCFTYQSDVLYNPKIEESEDECVVRSSISEPRGLLTVSWRAYQKGKSFLDDTGILLRQRERDRYASISIQNQEFETVAFQTDQEATVFADTKQGILVVSVHDFLGTKQEAATLVTEILATISVQ